MKKLITLIALVAIVMLAAAAYAVDPGANTLWGQENTAADGYAGINPKANGCSYGNSAALTNWIFQYGSGSYSGVYSWDGTAWGLGTKAGDEGIDVEADVEMYFQSSTTGNKIYFHIGNPFTATAADKEAVVHSTQTTNHPMYVGVTFNTGMPVWEGGTSAPTGKILGGMKGSKDIGGRTITDVFDVQFRLSVNGGGALSPNSAGSPGAHDTIPNSTMWWHPTTIGGPIPVGTANLDFVVDIFPTASQADGNYNLDPMISVAPEL